MLDEQAFRGLLHRVRAGDSQAAAELVRLYEPEIRRAIRIRLSGNRLRRQVDSADICQSVMHTFFLRAAAGQFDLTNPVQLLRLLRTMATNKLIDKARRPELHLDDPALLDMVPQTGETPSQTVAWGEMFDKVRGLLTDEERYLADQRVQGRDWAAIAADLGAAPEALRKRFQRALERVRQYLGTSGRDPGVSGCAGERSA